MTIADTPLAAFDPTDPDVLAERVPHEEMLAMRRTAPVSFVAQDEDARAGFPDHQGFWALSKHADVAAVSKNQTDFSTQANGVIMRFAPGMTKEERGLHPARDQRPARRPQGPRPEDLGRRGGVRQR